MHPAPSIILFTTLSGLGYGLAMVLGLGLLDPSATATKAAHVAALAMIAGGLASSALHLGNPQRAWRAFSQWRSSWLSREGLIAVIAFVPLTAAAAAALFAGRYLPAAGIAGALLSAATVCCTAMIYASLRAVDAWDTPLTPACYLLFSGAGGALLGAFAAVLGGGSPVPPLVLAALFLPAAWGVKLVWWRRLDGLAARSTPESATGLGFIGRVRLFERPHANENYLTREMGFRVARKHSAKLRVIALLFGGAVPFLLVLAVLLSGAGGILAASALAHAILFHALGILAERWLFFAEARHAVTNYYGG